MGAGYGNGQGLCCCPPGVYPQTCLLLDDPTTALFAFTIAGVINAGCIDCDKINGTWSGANSAGWTGVDPLCRWTNDDTLDPPMACDIGTSEIQTQLQIYCSGGITQVFVNVNYALGEIHYQRYINHAITLADLDGLVVPWLDNSDVNCDGAGSTVTIHVL